MLLVSFETDVMEKYGVLSTPMFPAPEHFVSLILQSIIWSLAYLHGHG
jgi:hypothetical protein